MQKGEKTVFISCFTDIGGCLKDAIALYSCFEAMVRKDTIVLHLYFEVSF